MAISPNTYTREYAYYFRGKDIALVERDFTDSSSVTYARWKSPNASVEDALKIEYVYKPFININNRTNAASSFALIDGLEAVQMEEEGAVGGKKSQLILLHTKHGTSVDLTGLIKRGQLVYLRNTIWTTGAYQVRDIKWDTYTLNGVSGDRNKIWLNSRAFDSRPLESFDVNYASDYMGTSSHHQAALFHDVSYINDPLFDLPYPHHLCLALVYYVKARLAEDQGNIEGKEYFLREFKKKMSEQENSKISGLRIISPGIHSIK